jgi:hypothetical protein
MPAHDHFTGAHNAITADASSDHLSGCMVALMPTEQDAARMAVDGGEAAADLHLTLAYLGPDANAWDDAARTELTGFLRSVIQSSEFGSWNSFTAKVFGAAHWNGDGDSPAWVWSVGDQPDDDSMDHDGDALEDYHDLVFDALESGHDHPDLPAPHSPWVAHICAAYSADDAFLPLLEAKLGTVTFDRLRLSFGDDDTDIPLNTDVAMSGPLTAAGMRRKPKGFESASTVDFALMDSSWKAAVDRAYVAWMAILSAQRQELTDQVKAAVDGGDFADLAAMTVSTAAAVDLLSEHMARFAQTAGQQQEHEADRQGVAVPPWALTDDDPEGVTASLSSAAKSFLSRMRAYASVVASSLANRMVSSASQRSITLAEADADGAAVARDVETYLADHPKAYVRQGIAAAMTMAQNTGRLAVLTAAPPGSYYASEMLDSNTCGPCRAIDGKEFATLNAAEDAYPAGGYVDCAGGSACRGTMVTVWDAGQTASATPKEGIVAETEDLGGKPNPGTKKDKRLKENDQGKAKAVGDADHFAAGASVSDKPWDGAASRFNDDQWKRATAACDGDGTPKEACFLPHHEPDGTLNRNGLHAAAQRVGSVTGRSPAAVAHAKSHLRNHYSQIGEDAPDSIAATLGDAVEMALAPADPDAVMPASDSNTAPWRGPLAVEGKTTGDGREFAAGSLTWRDLPVPLRWNKEDSHGGEAHTVAVNVGRIDKIWREGDLVMGEGVFNLAEADGQRAHDLVKGQFLRGVSIDADSISDKDVEYVWPDVGPEDGDGEDMDILDLLFAQPEKVLFHAGRISAATLCDIPAFAEAYVALLDSEGAVTAGGTPAGAQGGGGYAVRGVRARTVDGLTAAISAPDWKPPAEWFANPQLSLPTGIQVTDDGRVYGHAATWGSCHIGQADVCVQPPREENHPYYMTGEVVTADGGRVSVGQITVGTGHAPLSMGAVPATEHYDHTGHAVADVHVGNDEHGIWVAGAIRPGAPADLVHALRAAGQVSGDWRRIGSALRLVGLLAVNVPGFPVPKMATRVTASAAGSEVQTALVAAGRPPVAHGTTEKELIQASFRTVMDALSRGVHSES